MRNKIYDRIFIDLKKNSNLFTYKNLSNFESLFLIREKKKKENVKRNGQYEF